MKGNKSLKLSKRKRVYMIAELKGKVNRQNTTLTELREDELTGNFFGNMRYIPFAKGLKKVLKNAIRPAELQSMIDEADACYWNDHLFLWDKVRENETITELDVRMEFSSIVIGIEVKYRSGLSSEDTKSDENISPENSFNQLSREARVLRLMGANKKKLLLLLADDLVCAETIQDVKIIDGVQLGYLSWQEVLIQLKNLTELNDFEQLIVNDVIELLEKKGFLRFSGFERNVPDISINNFWDFKLPKARKKFSFEIDQIVEDTYYEFG